MQQPNLNQVSLRVSAGMSRQFPRDRLPQIAFSGRSNVGKSSLINCLLRRRSLARVSATPGKTVTINFYDVDKKLFFVDLPGYGYARRDAKSKIVWSQLTEDYFVKHPDRDLLRLVVQLIDIRVGPTEDDIDMINWLIGNNVPFIVVATKCDKLSRSALQARLRELEDGVFRDTDIHPIPFSSVTGDGRDILWTEFLRAIDR